MSERCPRHKRDCVCETKLFLLFSFSLMDFLPRIHQLIVFVAVEKQWHICINCNVIMDINKQIKTFRAFSLCQANEWLCNFNWHISSVCVVKDPRWIKLISVIHITRNHSIQHIRWVLSISYYVELWNHEGMLMVFPTKMPWIQNEFQIARYLADENITDLTDPWSQLTHNLFLSLSLRTQNLFGG